MGSSDGILQAGMLAPCEQVGAAPVAWIGRRDGEPLLFAVSDQVTVDLADLVKQAPAARLQVEVVGEIGQSPTFGPQWERLQTLGAKRIYGPPDEGGPVQRLVIRLIGLDARQPVKATLGVELTIAGQRQAIAVPVDLTPGPPKITTFRARPSILVTGAEATFAIGCERASSWTMAEVDGPTLASRDGLDPRTAVTAGHTIMPQASGPHRFRLTARSAGGEQRADVEVKVQDTEGWVAAPQWWSRGQVAGLCASPGGEVIYALVRTGGSASVWWSADGFGRWEELAPAPSGVVTSAPIACLRLESGLGLVVAGGSAVDPSQPSGTVWLLDVETKAWASIDDCWEPRTGHACVVAPDKDGAEKLWVIGGVDASDNAVGDVQVSADGRTWQRRATPGWAARCMFAATVKGSEIWVGGGFREPYGKAVPDIWTWDTKTGQERVLEAKPGVPMRLTESEWDLSALALTALDDVVHVVGVERTVGPEGTTYRTIDGRLTRDDVGYPTPPRVGDRAWSVRAADFRLNAVAFNGCIWLFTQRPLGKHLIESEGLYYWVPPRKGSRV
jgi:hypothetical protein